MLREFLFFRTKKSKVSCMIYCEWRGSEAIKYDLRTHVLDGGIMADAWIGVDPGAKGAACLINGDSIQFCRWSVDPGHMMDMFRQWKLNYDVKVVVVEKVGARPGQGVTSMFTFGENSGWWKGAMHAIFGEEPVLIRPQKWQKEMLDDSDVDIKKKSVLMANKLAGFDFKLTKNGIDNGKADAYHLARYAKKLYKDTM